MALTDITFDVNPFLMAEEIPTSVGGTPSDIIFDERGDGKMFLLETFLSAASAEVVIISAS